MVPAIVVKNAKSIGVSVLETPKRQLETPFRLRETSVSVLETPFKRRLQAVSYTHLTLPTILLV